MRANLLSPVLAVAGFVTFALLATSPSAGGAGHHAGASSTAVGTASVSGVPVSSAPGTAKVGGPFCGALVAMFTGEVRTATAATRRRFRSQLRHLEAQVTRLVSLAPSAEFRSEAREVEHASVAFYDAAAAARFDPARPYPQGLSLLAVLATFHGQMAHFEAAHCTNARSN
ncbi:MAG: hypothetical protein ACYCST_04455 [Acidimicrobiales bacterium]